MNRYQLAIRPAWYAPVRRIASLFGGLLVSTCIACSGQPERRMRTTASTATVSPPDEGGPPESTQVTTRDSPQAAGRSANSDVEGSNASAPPEEENSSDQETEEPNGSGAAAIASYSAAQRAYNRGDNDAYQQRFSRIMECWYGDRDVEFGREPAARHHVLTYELRLLFESPREVVLADFGAYTDANYYRVATHRKLVRMRLRGDEWLIVAETSLESPGCLGVGGSGESLVYPQEFVRCARAQRRCLRQLERDYPGPHDGTMGEEAERMQCNCGLWRCLGGSISDIACFAMD